MVNIKSTISQVKQGNYPSNWQVYGGLGNYNYAILCWIIIVVIFITGIGLTVYAVSIIEFGNAIAMLLMTLYIVIPLIAIAQRMKLKADDKEHAILVVLPKAVIQCNSDDLKEISWLYFPNIDRIELAQKTEIISFDGEISSRTYSWLDIYSSDGTYMKWRIGNWFGDTASISKAIITCALAVHSPKLTNAFKVDNKPLERLKKLSINLP
ncbi:MAG: hypothetical protein ACRDIV_00710 [Ktedonobacteraceae bacterium]